MMYNILNLFGSRFIMTRREARDSAFILIFEKEINGFDTDLILEIAEECEEIQIDDYTKKVFCGVYENLQSIDEVISKYSVSWNIKRISKVALAVLRLAIYEIKFVESVPVSVSINEAVEIAKKYSTKEDSVFINGILSSVAKENNE